MFGVITLFQKAATRRVETGRNRNDRYGLGYVIMGAHRRYKKKNRENKKIFRANVPAAWLPAYRFTPLRVRYNDN